MNPYKDWRVTSFLKFVKSVSAPSFFTGIVLRDFLHWFSSSLDHCLRMGKMSNQSVSSQYFAVFFINCFVTWGFIRHSLFYIWWWYRWRNLGNISSCWAVLSFLLQVAGLVSWSSAASLKDKNVERIFLLKVVLSIYLHVLRRWYALWPQYSDRFKNSHGLLVCSVFFLFFWRQEWQLPSCLHITGNQYIHSVQFFRDVSFKFKKVYHLQIIAFSNALVIFSFFCMQ
jgi:hypothetical protein